MTLRLLSTLIAVGTVSCSLDWSQVPSIPAGRRAQYYLLHQDGGYKFGYDTGEGSSAQASADPANEVQGGFSYDSSAGPVSLTYTAGIAGFVPILLGQSGAASAGKSISSEEGTADLKGEEPSGDASYSFGFSAKDQSRTESSDSLGNIQGSYSYLSTDGNERKVDYEAGIGKGFIVKSTGGSKLTSSGSTSYTGESNVKSIGSTGAGYAFSYDAGDHSRSESSDESGNVKGSFSFTAKDDGQVRKIDYEAGSQTGFVARGSHLPEPPVQTSILNQQSFGEVAAVKTASSEPTSVAGLDGSYSFAFDAGDHSRQESSDATGNVRGSYEFVSKGDGLRRKVTYEAGAEKGFVARGDHLPEVGYPVASFKSGGTDQTSSWDVSTRTGANSGEYEFSYDAGDHSRQESSDSGGNVRGSFSFVSKDDGKSRRIDYEAGADKGFVAKGAHLPQSPALPQSISQPSPPALQEQPTIFSTSLGQGSVKSSANVQSNTVGASSTSKSSASALDGSYSFKYDAGDHSREESADSLGNVRGSFSFVPKGDGIRRRVDYEAGSETGFIARGSHLPQQVSALSNYQGDTSDVVISKTSESNLASPSDGSYSFSYDAGDHSRQESSDARGNVRGSYKFTAKGDGKSRKVEYEAGAETGFVARGEHLPQPPSLLDIAGAKISSSGVSTYEDSNTETGGDASYAYSYKTDSSSKQESSDSAGNVVGSFSYTAGDGVARNIHYTSKGNEGFLASGDILPVAATAGRSYETVAAKSNIHADDHHTVGVQTHLASGTPFVKSYLPPNEHQKFGYIYDTRQ